MKISSSRPDRLLGAACLVACPAISGVFLGLVAALCVSPGGHAIAIGVLVGAGGFAANALAIGLTAFAVEHHARHRAIGPRVRSGARVR